MHRGVFMTAGFRARLFLLGIALLGGAPLRSAELSEPAPLAARSLLLGLARAGSRLVAVGDRGHVLLSDDEGLSWRQVVVPTRAMLTAVSFPDADHGWAVGHDGVILVTADAGQSWQRQDSGTDLETVYLDVLFLNARRGFAVGAYGKFIATADGGATWTPAKPAAEEVHYNRLVAAPNGRLFLAGESGTLLVSQDGGQTWTRSEVPYDGSLFCLVPLDNQAVVVAGLREHILTSFDNGRTWQPCPSETPSLIMGGTRLLSGVIVLGGQGGSLFVSRDGGTSFVHWKPAESTGSIAALIEADAGTLVAVGENGALRLKIPAAVP